LFELSCVHGVYRREKHGLCCFVAIDGRQLEVGVGVIGRRGTCTTITITITITVIYIPVIIIRNGVGFSVSDLVGRFDLALLVPFLRQIERISDTRLEK
jgi:hypothetical protein